MRLQPGTFLDGCFQASQAIFHLPNHLESDGVQSVGGRWGHEFGTKLLGCSAARVRPHQLNASAK